MDPDTGIEAKNMNPIGIDDILDLTPHMAAQDSTATDPVRYKLHSVTYHEGEDIHTGHYAAGVTGPKMPGQKVPAPQFFVDDGAVRPWNAGAVRPNALTKNPVVMRGGARFDAVVLWYEIMAVEKEKGKGARKKKNGERVETADMLCLREGKGIVDRLRRETLARGYASERTGRL
jgi:hypothetical protein